MKITLITLGLLALSPALAQGDPVSAESAGIQAAPDDLPPPRRSTRRPRPAADLPATPGTEPAPATADLAGDLPPLAPRERRARGFVPSVKGGVDDFLVEAGVLPDAPEADTYSTLRAAAYVLWQPGREWEFRLGARVDGMSQTGGAARHDELLADYSDTYVRYRNGDTRLTLGAQTIVWGRVDEIPLADRVSRADLTRFVLDDLPDRRRAQLAARWEQTLGEYKLDLVWLPVFRAAQLPDLESVWSPVNRTTGRIVGIAPTPALSAFLSTAQVDEDEHGSGGGALRLTRTGDAVDFGVTLARTRQSLPYYRADLLASRLTAVHPYNSFIGADMEMVRGGQTWRMELGYTDGVPYTRPDFSMDTTRALDWVGAVEFFPGGGDTRVNLQLVAHALETDRGTLELDEYYGANGEIESRFGNGRWKAGLRFSTGFNVDDVYLSPRLAYVGWEPHELYLALHYFDGEAATLGGFHADHSMLTLGLRTRF